MLDMAKIRRRRIRRAIVALIFLVIILTIVQNYIQGIKGPSPVASNILVFSLFNINIILLMLLIFFVFRNIVKLYFERKSQTIGAKFKTKLVTAFIGFSLIPAILLFVVASGLITNSIDNWFNEQIEKSLENAQVVVDFYYNNLSEEALLAAEQFAKYLADQRLLKFSRDGGVIEGKKQASLEKALETFRANYSLDALQIFNRDQEMVDYSIHPALEVHKDNLLIRNTYRYVRRSLAGGTNTRVKSLEEGVTVRGFAPIWQKPIPTPVGAVAVTYYIPRNIATKISEISKTFEEYRGLKILKGPIKFSYIITFLVITLLIIFSATWFGFYLAKGITVPIQKLAEATRYIARGNLEFNIDVEAKDEIGILVSSFNQMTEELKNSQVQIGRANEDLRQKNIELDQRRNYIETVLKNVAAGVISIDKKSKITTINKSAESLLELNADSLRGKPYQEVFMADQYYPILDLINKAGGHDYENLEEQVKLVIGQKPLTLIIHVSVMTNDSNNPLGMVLVLDDLTELIKAQKTAAWREIARGIAHEIKNPLTPIQLSAQRLKKKYMTRSIDLDEVFDECVDTIINQVDDIRGLVDEFSLFARMPESQPKPGDLHKVIDEVIALYRVSHKDLEIMPTYDYQINTLELDRDQIKRLLINLIENAIEAANGWGKIYITTCLMKEAGFVRIDVADEGTGIALEDKDKLFLPYFSRKKGGTGLGLAIVNRIVEDHHGYITVNDNHPKGTVFSVHLPITPTNP
jgi:two-component system nitrogen regulation sensor histidine kinase NtrY